jgi:hypothetical protein
VRLQDAMPWYGMFAAVEERLGDPTAGAVSDGCAGGGALAGRLQQRDVVS